MTDISIITPSLNQGRFLREALSSVAVDHRYSLEHIVVDGGSTDDSLAILERHRPEVVLCHRPGLNSHEAINLGLELARGSVIGILNTDDIYEAGALTRVLETFQANPRAQALCGSMRFFADPGNAAGDERRGHLQGEDFLLEATFGAPGLNSWFYRAPFLKRLGPLEQRFDYSADRDFLIRLYFETAPLVVPDLLYHYRVHHESRTLAPRRATRRAIAGEHMDLARRYLACFPDHSPRAKLFAAWWAMEWMKHKLLGGALSLSEPLPPLTALPRALLARRRLRRLFHDLSHR